jgi:hypothetical protein
MPLWATEGACAGRLRRRTGKCRVFGRQGRRKALGEGD